MQRIVVGLAKNGDLKIPKFAECLVDCFKKDAESVKVEYCLDDRVLVLHEAEEGVQLQHSVMCPIKALADWEGVKSDTVDIADEKRNLEIPVAVSMVLESSDNHVLLTKRPAHMRSSPKVWVMPGGHLEYGESLLECGSREVKEETGLDVADGKTSLLCLWENVYPLLLGIGPPSNHVLIVYFHTLLNETHQELTDNMKPDPEEVEGFCWVSRKALNDMFNGIEAMIGTKQYILKDGRIFEDSMTYPHEMFNKRLWSSKKSFSGVQHALRTWASLKSNNSSPSKL